MSRCSTVIRPKSNSNNALFLFLVALLLAVAGSATWATEVRIFRMADNDQAIAGDLEGIAVDPDGVLELARQVERLAGLDEPFIFTAAGSDSGWLVGTGSSGKVLSVDDTGEVEELFAAEEPQIFAVYAEPDGSVLAASSPVGKVYRIADGESEVLFDPEATYIWSVARDTKGRLLVATGLPGQLLRVDAKGQAKVLYEGRDAHVRALHPLPDGSVLVGTAGRGLVVRVDAAGKATTLFDAVSPEVLSFAAGEGGTVYAAVLASEASLVDLSAAEAKSNGEKSGEGSASVTVVEQGEVTIGSRGAGYGGPRSAVLEIQPGGTVEVLATFADETIHSLAWHDGELWVGTGQEGNLYRIVRGELVLERTLEEKQITALAVGKAGLAAVTANGSAVYRLKSEPVTEGTYVSKILDASQVARFGTFLWQGEVPRGGAVELAFRSGQSTVPDGTWSDWTTVKCGDGSSCRSAGRRSELSLSGLDPARYVQWRAQLRGGNGASPRIELTELTYRQNNVAPEIQKFEVLDPGEILVPSSFNPQNQTYEPWSPNREGIFTSLEAADEKDGRLKTLWKKGYRSVRWTVEDPNGDTLQYRLEVRREGSESWLTVVEELDKNYYSFDSTVLPDGVYRFRLVADDSPSLGTELAQEEDEVSPPVVIDHAAPRIQERTLRDGTLQVVLEDALSPIRRAEISVDAGAWRPAVSTDGLVDGRRESLRLEVPEGASMLLLRLTDAAWNVVTFDLLQRNP